MNMKRMRGRNHRSGGGGNSGGFRNQQNGIPLNRNHVFDSSGPEMRVRGTAQQLYEKYQQLARDAFSNGDRVTGESYYQHAEHYFRIISAINQAQGQNQGQNPGHASQGHPQGQNAQHGQNGQAPYQNGGQGQERNGSHAEPNGQHVSQNRRFEPGNGDRQHDLQLGEPGPQEHRGENRAQEGRNFEPRRQEPRNRPDFQRQERNGERQERPREVPVVDARIDISSALEAELTAAAEGRALPEPAAEAPQPAPEARAIPIIPDAPPPAELQPAAAEAAEAPAPAPARTPRPRGRPRTKAAAKE